LSLVDVIPPFIALVLSLSFHEAAHAWTADRLGDPTARMLGRLTLNPMAHIDLIGTVLFPLIAMTSGLPIIGWAKPVPVNWNNLRHPRRDFAVVALAGPVSNLILASVGATVFMLLPAPPDGTLVVTTPVGDLLFMFVRLNVLLAVFNMIPVPPLDGGNVLMGLVPESAARAIDRLRPYGFLILYAMLFLHVFEAITTPVMQTLYRWLLR
jgi:Zn-dependent protease